MKLEHYTRKPLDKLRNRDVTERAGHLKPAGLWVSVVGENDWPHWCRVEEFGNIDKCLRYEIELKEDANILMLCDETDIDAFTLDFECEAYPGIPIRHKAIDWTAVAKIYAGIIIAPYIYTRRLTDHTYWYYGWDCASGCIWDVSCIESVQVVSEAALS